LAESSFTVPVALPARLRINSRSGKVTVVAEDRADILVERGATRQRDVEITSANDVTIKSSRGGSEKIELRCPTGTDLVIGTLSGSVNVEGRAGAVMVSTASGNITVERVLAADLRSVSGSLSVDTCSGRCRLKSTSGGAVAGDTGSAEVSTISGKIELGRVGGPVKARTASGKVHVTAAGAHDVSVHSLSGAISIKLPAEVRPSTRIRTFSGRARNDFPEGHDCHIEISTMSGKVEVGPA